MSLYLIYTQNKKNTITQPCSLTQKKKISKREKVMDLDFYLLFIFSEQKKYIYLYSTGPSLEFLFFFFFFPKKRTDENFFFFLICCYYTPW